jgi:hypothetical protein
LARIQLTETQKEDAISLSAEGKTLKEICAVIGCSVRELMTFRAHDNYFNENILRAQVIGFEVQADKLQTAHEDIPNPLSARLFSENTRWLLSRRAASKYGDRIDVTVGQTVDISKALDDARKRSLLSSVIHKNSLEDLSNRVEEIIEVEHARITESSDNGLPSSANLENDSLELELARKNSFEDLID